MPGAAAAAALRNSIRARGQLSRLQHSKHAHDTMRPVAVVLAALAPLAAADLCTEGCSIDECTCFTPFFSCNPSGGTCVPLTHVCDGSCDMETWFIAVLAVVGVLIVAGCVTCCCGKAIRESCCPPRRYKELGPAEGFYYAEAPSAARAELAARGVPMSPSCVPHGSH